MTDDDADIRDLAGDVLQSTTVTSGGKQNGLGKTSKLVNESNGSGIEGIIGDITKGTDQDAAQQLASDAQTLDQLRDNLSIAAIEDDEDDHQSVGNVSRSSRRSVSSRRSLSSRRSIGSKNNIKKKKKKKDKKRNEKASSSKIYVWSSKGSKKPTTKSI
mmetsp:Transcript_30479/g.43223  ORF Transcript_30479/g.43223 Transcript_30479/m.43223 type:complete len:159 (-) Transcript_30479:2124-2600(-)